MGEIMAIYIV